MSPATAAFEIFQGDVIAGLRGLPSDSVHCCVTSPPYWGLRDYGIEPSIWSEDRDCPHEWDEREYRLERHGDDGTKSFALEGASETQQQTRIGRVISAYCSRCGAWRGCLGLEPTPELFLDHIVEVFRHVRRVLHSTGTLWLNMGDSYCSDGGKDRKPTTLPGSRVPAGWTNRAQPTRVHALRKGADCDPRRRPAAEGAVLQGVTPQGALKPKDLCMMPARVALALQADGWWLRSQIPWLKKNGMPESAADRPTSMVEYIFLFSKSAECFYDREAVRIAAASGAHARGGGVNPKAVGPNSRIHKDRDPSHQTESKIRAKQNRSFSAAVVSLVSSRARRNSDWFFSSLESYDPKFQGLLVDESGDPVAMLVNPQPFSVEMCGCCDEIYSQREFRKLPQREDKTRICACGESEWVGHFATFPERLVEPCILAGTSEYGCCGHCGAPYERIVEKRPVGDWHPDPKHKHSAGAVNGTAKSAKESLPAPATTGWRPTCSHPLFPCDPVPCVVLDPFTGSARTGVAAIRHGRVFRGMELNPRYARMGEWQLRQVVRSLEEVSKEVAVG